jgi:hypothetical protein
MAAHINDAGVISTQTTASQYFIAILCMSTEKTQQKQLPLSGIAGLERML